MLIAMARSIRPTRRSSLVNFGFHSIGAPTVQPAQLLTHMDLSVTLDLADQAVDPAGDPLTFRIVGALGGTATLD